MPMIGRLVGGLRGLFRKQQADQDLDDELRAYLETAVEQKMAAGMSRADASRAARVEMGGFESTKDRVRDVGWESVIESVWLDIRYAIRMMRQSPGFTAVAVLSLALGIGANTAVFTFLNALLLRPLPVSHPEELVELKTPYLISFPMYLDLRAGQEVFTDIAATQPQRAFRLTIAEAADRTIELDNVPVAATTGNYFELLGIRPAAGRFFTADDDRLPNSSETMGSAIVLSDAFWDRQFGRRAGLPARPPSARRPGKGPVPVYSAGRSCWTAAAASSSVWRRPVSPASGSAPLPTRGSHCFPSISRTISKAGAAPSPPRSRG